MNYLIDFTQDATDEQISSYLATNDCITIKVYNNFDKVYLVEAQTLPPTSDIITSVINDSGHQIQLLGDIVVSNQYVGIIDPSKPTTTFSTTEEKHWWKNYVLDKPVFDQPDVTIQRRGSSASVYILDSGIDVSHPEFVDTNITNLFSFTGEFGDTKGHGTALASVISGKTCGLTSSHLKIVKILDSTKETLQSDILNALDAILDDFLQLPSGLGILNCSWSIPHNAYIEQKIGLLIAAGIYVVVSAGNSGLPITDVTPASMTDVLTIGSFSKALKPSDFSNYTGESVISNTSGATNTGALDGWAPGEQILVATLNGGYGYAVGTSIAAGIHSSILSYKFDSYVIDGELIPFGRNKTLDFIANLSLGREELLDLSDIRYSNSSHKISTISSNIKLADIQSKYNLRNWCRASKGLATIVFNPQTTVSIEILTPLPEGFSINSSGLLYSPPLDVVGDYQVFEYSIRVSCIDGSKYDSFITTTVISDSYNITETPIDPVVKVNTESCPLDCSRGAGCDLDGGMCNWYYSGKTLVWYCECPNLV